MGDINLLQRQAESMSDPRVLLIRGKRGEWWSLTDEFRNDPIIHIKGCTFAAQIPRKILWYLLKEALIEAFVPKVLRR